MTDNVITFDVAEAKKLRRCRLMGGIRQGGYRYNKARYDLLEAYWHFDQCSEYVGPAIDEIAAVMDELLVDSQERWTAMPNGELVFAPISRDDEQLMAYVAELYWQLYHASFSEDYNGSPIPEGTLEAVVNDLLRIGDEIRPSYYRSGPS